MDAGHDDELVKLRIDGPGGPAVVALTKDMPLEVLKQVLDAKAGELCAGASQREQVLLSPYERGETLKLISWVNEQEARLAAMSVEQRKKHQIQSEKLAESQRQSAQKELEKLRLEELKGKRITIYQSNDSLLSVSEASSKEQLEIVQKYLGHKLDEAQIKSLKKWTSKQHTKHHALESEIAISIKTADGSLKLSEASNADLLKLALAEHKSELSQQQAKQVQKWIDSASKQEADKVRIFHSGKQHPLQSSEISLSLHGKAYVDELYLQLGDTAYMLPEHRKKLDRYYKDLSEGKTKEPELLELPSNLPGRFTYFAIDTEREVLEVALATRKDLLSKESKEKLEEWIAGAKESKQKKDTLRIYDATNPTVFVTVNKAMNAEEIDQEIERLGSSVAFMKTDAAKTLSKWMESPDALPETVSTPDSDRINATHDSGITLSIDNELVLRHPEKLKEILSDSTWSLPEEDRKKLQAQLSPIATEKSDEFYFEGTKYSNSTSLKVLKDFAAQIAEDEQNNLPPQHAKKLLTWITRKEKLGEQAQVKEYEAKEEYANQQRIQHLGRLNSLLNDMASSSSSTVDGYYSEIWGADKSALALGPRGAMVGGLRPMGLWQFTEVIQAALRDNLYKKNLAGMHEAAKEALHIKKGAEKSEPVPEMPKFKDIGHGSGLMSNAEKQIHRLGKEKLDLAFAQIYSAIQHQKSKEISRRPNRNNKDIDENILPGPGAHRGPGGFGGMGY